MNRKDKKVWLQETWNLQRTIEYLDLTIKDSLTNPADCTTDKICTLMTAREAATKELEKRKTAINRLKDGTQKKVLWLRYMAGYTWRQVCRAENYSRSTINLLHDKALDQVKIL